MHWAALLDRPSIVAPCERPAPRPPAAARPDRISVTEVETLIADPYAFYAKRVLRLPPLDPLDAEVGAADYGTLVHARHGGASSAASARSGRGATPPRRISRRRRKRRWRRSARIPAWPPSGARASSASAPSWSRGRRSCARAAASPRSHTETKGLLELRHRDGRTVSLTARADRLDRRADGTFAILDYKTGTLPSARRWQEGHKPQLLLEAAMAAAGRFEGVEAGDASELTYWRLTGGPEPGEVRTVMREAQAIERGGRPTRWNGCATSPTASCSATPPSPRARTRAARRAGGDYDHLSRLAEWSGAEDAEAGS